MTFIEDLQERITQFEVAKIKLEESISIKEVDLMNERGSLKQIIQSITLCKGRLKKAESGG